MFKNPHKRIYLAIFLSTTPFLWLFSKADTVGGYLPAIANILGFVGAVLLLWQFLLGFRFLASNIDTHYAWINTLHKRLGKYGSVFVLTHPFLEATTFGIRIFTSMDLSSEFIRGVIFGRTAFYLYLAIFITSIFFRKKLKYRPWLYIHYLSYPLLFFVFLHASSIGTFISTYHSIAVYWNILTFSFYAILIARVLFFLNFFKKKFTLISKKKISSDITVYEFKSSRKISGLKPGQYYYIRSSFFGESHPYSVLEFNPDENIITFGVKAVGKNSKFLETLDIEKTVYLDGPYGRFTEEGQNSDPKIILAGGIGVTPFLELVKNYANDKTYMFYSNRRLSEAVGREIFKQKLGKRYFDVVTREDVSGDNTKQGRISIKMIKENVPESILKNSKIFICGSPGFINACKAYCTDLNIDKKNIFTEEFSL